MANPDRVRVTGPLAAFKDGFTAELVRHARCYLAALWAEHDLLAVAVTAQPNNRWVSSVRVSVNSRAVLSNGIA
jgi:hypothetical protein